MKYIHFLAIFLLMNSCSSREVKYEGLNDLVVGVHQFILYENNNFYLELSLGGVEGIYKIKNDTIYLKYDKKPQNWPDKFILTKEYFVSIEENKNARLIKIKRNK